MKCRVCGSELMPLKTSAHYRCKECVVDYSDFELANLPKKKLSDTGYILVTGMMANNDV